jgi:hypothetical protein
VIVRLLAMLALMLAPIGADTALAHQQKFAISTVTANPRTGMIEVVHQVSVHDAEHALMVQRPGNADVPVPDIIGSAASRDAFARYVSRRFLLEIDGAVVIPDLVGSEIDGGSLWVYQEVPMPAGGEARLRVNSQLLTDVWARQENRVNVGGGTNPATFVFHTGDAPAEAMLRL